MAFSILIMNRSYETSKLNGNTEHEIEKETLPLNSIQPILGFPDSSVGKESACNAGDPGSITGSGRSAGEGIGYPLQLCASLVAQLVKNLPAMQEIWVRFLGWKDTLEKVMATHSSILAWEVPWTEEPSGLQSVWSQIDMT